MRLILVATLILFSCTEKPFEIKKVVSCSEFINLFDTTQVSQHATKAEFIFDSTGLLFMAELYDPNVKASITQHDTTIFLDPCIEFFLDPGADGKDYYEFEINALGYGWALQLKSNQPPLNDPSNMSLWDVERNYQARVIGTVNDTKFEDGVEEKWLAVMNCGWDKIKEGRPEKGDIWAYNFMRIDYDDENKATYWVAQPTGKDNMHHPDTWPTFTF